MYEWMKRDEIPARAPSGSAAALSYLRGNPRWPVVTGTLGGRHLGAIAQLEERLVCIQKARGSSPLSSTGQKPNAILKASKQSQTKSQTRQRTGRRQHRMTPREDLDRAALGDTLPSWWAPRRDAILRPPKPEISPSAKILQLAAEQDIELGAGG